MSSATERPGLEWLNGEYTCSLCGARYHTQERADACASKGIQENPFVVGLELMLVNDEIVRITGLLTAAQISHEPGVTFELPPKMAELMELEAGAQQVVDAKMAQAMRERFLANR